MVLDDLLQAYVESHDLDACSVKQLRVAINGFSEHLGRRATLTDFADIPVNRWLGFEVARVKKRTARNKRACLITLWRWAYEEGIVNVAPRRVRKIAAPLPPVDAYTPEEVESLLAASLLLTNRFCKIAVERRLLYRALILVAFQTGFRPNDLMVLRHESIAPNGCVRITQHKTGRIITRWLDKDAMGAIEAITLPKQPLVFGGFTCVETWRSVHRGLRKIAGVKRGTPKWIRRAMATSVAAKYGNEAAGVALGHVTPGLALKHYIDQSQLLSEQYRTPRLKRRKPPKLTG